MNSFLLFFTKFSVVKKFMHRSGVEYQEFPSKTFCLTVPRNFVGKPFSVSLLSGAEKVWIRERVENQDFPSKTFCLTVPRNFVGRPFSVSLLSGAEKVWIRERREYQDFLEKIFCRNFSVSQCRKIS